MSLEVVLSSAQLDELANRIAARLSLAVPAPAPLKIGYTIKEAAQVSGKTVWAIRNAIDLGELPATKNGLRGAYTIHHEHLDAFVRGVPPVTFPARSGVRQRKAR